MPSKTKTVMSDPFAFLEGDSVEAASRLLGCILEFEHDGHVISGKIVETEAYHQTDAASHSYKGSTPRTEVMFGPASHAYVYFTYGMHYCMNVVTGPVGEGSAVLIRALEPLEGMDIMAGRRGTGPSQLTNGPAKLCQAFGIGKQFNGHDLHKSPLKLLVRPPLSRENITRTTRIGITRDAHRPWRFYIRGNAFISRP
jgi:DNA-3-methyladenine glycosylase